MSQTAAWQHKPLYHNNHDGTFTDVAQQMGVADVNQPGTGVSMGAVWGDYDNDGYEDLYLSNGVVLNCFITTMGTASHESLSRLAFPPWINANTAVWFDYDGDGLLDLFVGGYYPENVDLWHLKNTKMMPESFEYAKNGGRKYLFHNLGNGKFEEVSAKVGINSRRGHSPPPLPICADRVIPICSSPMITASPSYISTTASISTKPEKQTGIGFSPKSGMNVAFGDIFNQGRYSVYVSNISEDGVLSRATTCGFPKEGTSGNSSNMRTSPAIWASN